MLSAWKDWKRGRKWSNILFKAGLSAKFVAPRGPPHEEAG